ncbi:hypothetical protein [Paracoccus liaowanqingii]|nr:hypothetical protein [Paracoccus liaowanqingii]
MLLQLSRTTALGSKRTVAGGVKIAATATNCDAWLKERAQVLGVDLPKDLLPAGATCLGPLSNPPLFRVHEQLYRVLFQEAALAS